jgi:hypothetical protein
MNVDVSRQPNINSDGISCLGETKPGKLGYLGYYFISGSIRKTSMKTSSKDIEGNLMKVEFNDAEFGTDAQIIIEKDDNEKLSFQFYVEVDE